MKISSLAVLAFLSSGPLMWSQSIPAGAALPASYGDLPLSFEVNCGQADPRVQFVSRGNGYSLYLTGSAAVLSLSKGDLPANSLAAPSRKRSGRSGSTSGKSDIVRMELAGSEPGIQVEGLEQLPGIANYFPARDPATWHRNIPTYAKVKYAGVYPGVDLLYYGNQRRIEYDFVLAPGASSKPLRLHFAGAGRVTLDPQGDLLVHGRNGAIAFRKPVVYQTENGRRMPINGRFALLAKNTVGFSLGAYDHTRELVIDPVLAYSTYLGSSGVSSGYAIAVDNLGNAYVTGIVTSTAAALFPTTDGSFQRAAINASTNTAFISKLNPAGSALAYSTYLGGDAIPGAIAVDLDGDAYVTGGTFSNNFPVTPDAFQTSRKNVKTASQTGFVTKLNASGSALVYSTYLGGSGSEGGSAISVDRQGNAYVAGSTDSLDFPVTSAAFQRFKHAPLGTGFLTKLNPQGTGVVYSSYLGGSFHDSIAGLALAPSGEVYVTGSTSSDDFPTTADSYATKAPYTMSSASRTSAFVSEFNSTGSSLLYSTFLTGTPTGTESRYGDGGAGIAVDVGGNAYVTGTASAINFPVTNGAFQVVNRSQYHSTAFVTKLNPSGSALLYSTYLGGTSDDTPGLIAPIAVDRSGDAYIAGSAGSTDFPVTPDAFQSVNLGAEAGSLGGFLTELDPTGSALIYSTFLTGDAYTALLSLALDAIDNVYLTGNTTSYIFPYTPGGYNGPAHGENALVAKIALHGATTTTLTSNENPQSFGGPVTFTAVVKPSEGTGVTTGTVSFLTEGSVIAHANIDGTGHATYTTSTLPVGQQTVVASYLGDPVDYSASSGVLVETIDNGKVATPTFPILGGTYPGAFYVPVETATPGATIHYTTDGSTPGINSAVYLNAYTVYAYNTTTVKAIAVENGNVPSAVATATYNIVRGAIPTSTAIQSSENPSLSGQPVTFTATVTPATGPASSGTVTFKNGAVIVGSAPLVDGVATFTTSAFTLNANALAAIYTGSAINAASGVSMTQIVDAP